MKRLSKIKLQNALVLEDQEMKVIYGGSGGSGGSSDCKELACDLGAECWENVSNTLKKGKCKWYDIQGSGAGPIAGRHCVCEI